MKRALVTGGTGFIGSHVVRALLDRSVEVRALVLPGDPAVHLRDLPVEQIAGDVCDAAALALAMRGIDHVFHLAAIYLLWSPDPGLMHRVNVEGTRNVLEQAARAGVQRVIHTSSIARFGGQGLGRRATEHSEFRLAVDPYCRSKAESHELAVAAAAAGQDVVIVAPTGPIGPGDLAPTPTGKLLMQCVRMPIVAVPHSVCNFGDVRSIAEGHLLAAERGKSGESYLLGDRDLTFAQIAELALAALGKSAPVIEVPDALAGAAATVLTAIANRITHRAPLVTRESAAIARLGLAADCSKAERELGYRARPIDIAVADALADFRRRGVLR
ncbi:MAG TPA: SDR family oxidoreductase [Nannocystaceae bacterium]|nr:SDR family oxidoreductase [Nannocystaceae bacterium]